MEKRTTIVVVDKKTRLVHCKVKHLCFSNWIMNHREN